MDTILGIDLGTTNSEVAVLRDGHPVVLDDDGDPILPSVVGLAPDGRLLVGRAARNQWVLAPERTVKSVKRLMGRDTKVTLGDQSYTPQEVSAMILRALRDRAAAHGVTATRAVVTVPAYFNDAQRQATREAGELAGLEVVRILNEPTAAALAYDPRRTERRHVLVYDLGGGTFDCSIVLAEAGVVEVLASHGDTHLGGDDFDELLFNLLCDRFQARHGIDPRQNVAAKARLLRAAEAAKRTLSDHPFARVEEEFIAEKAGVALHVNEEISRAEYEDLIRPLIDRTMDCLRRALEDARIAPREVDEVVLVGGSTRTPMVGALLEDRLGKPARREVNPDLIVAMGAALQGGLVAGQDVGAVLVDITPHSLGIRCVDELPGFGMPFLHRFAPIVPRNTPLPASRSELFRTVHDGQAAVEIEVFQGEDDDVRNNTAIGRFLVEGLTPAPAGNLVVVQLDLTLDGTLKVSAREKATGLSKQIVIDNALARFARDERSAARDRIDRLWTESFGLPQPGDLGDGEDGVADELDMPLLDPGPREGAREAVQAKALLEKAERLTERVQPEDRPELERLMAAVRAALQDRDWDRLGTASDELADALFYLEDV
jgi:molecular chaperone DnaK